METSLDRPDDPPDDRTMDTSKPQHYSKSRSFQHSIGVQVLQQYMRWEEGDTVLDVGCGTGELCKYISQQPGVASVVGFDPSSDFISYASQHNSSHNVLYHVADASDVSTIKPEWKGAFTKMVSNIVLHWIPDKVSTLQVLHSCLKPHGEVLFTCVTDECNFYRMSLDMASHPKWKKYLKEFVPNLFPWPSDDLLEERNSSRLLEECGFEVLSCRVDKFQHCYDSMDRVTETFRAIFPHLRHIPQNKHEEFLEDVMKMAVDYKFIPVEGDPTAEHAILIVHAKKL